MVRFDAAVERCGPFRWRWSVTSSGDGEPGMEQYGYRRTAKAAHLLAYRIKEHREIAELVKFARRMEEIA